MHTLRSDTFRRDLRFIATALLVAFLAAVGQAHAEASPVTQRPMGPRPSSISAPDPRQDVTVTGDLTGLLGPQDVYDAVDITKLTAEALSSKTEPAPAQAYTLSVSTAGVFTGDSNLLPILLTSKVTYDLTWRTVDRRGRVSEVPESVRLAATVDGLAIERISLPPRCRNDDGLSATQIETSTGEGLLTLTVPRTCSKGTSGVPSGVANLRVTAGSEYPGGALFGSYRDDATVDGSALFPRGR